MTRKEALEKLEELRGYGDPEVVHIEADAILLEYIGDSQIEEAYAAVVRYV